jgi:hypothetical protein
LNYSIISQKENKVNSTTIKPEEWPELSEDVLKSSTKHEFKNKSQQYSKIKKQSSISFKQEITERAVKEDVEALKVPWRVETKPTQSMPSLLDVMNDELKILTINSAQVYKKPSFETSKNEKNSSSNESPKTKTWNIHSSPSADKAISSFATIVEMEKRSNELYNKIKNRPLNLIQIEEKAIEDLKKFYNVENCFNMEFAIEVVDDSHMNKLAPLWQKK